MIDESFPLYALTFALTFLLTVVCERLLIPRLSVAAKQPIYTDGPKWHISKSGTPTMGGLAFLLAISLCLGLAAVFLWFRGERGSAISLLLCLGYAVLNSVIGILDDSKKLKKKQNAGLSPREKLILQLLLAVLFLLLRDALIPDSRLLTFSFGSYDIGWLYLPLSIAVLLGITNCANLTDGIDGLASGVGFAVGISLFYISCALSSEVSFISASVVGATTGFLVFNLHPAKIFMGDTGSLFLGSLGAASAFALGNPLVILFIGGVYCLEGLSVIIQVAFFKLSGKRVFKMAPLHHHLEKSGWSENRICIVAIIMTFIFSIPAFAFYLP